MKELELLAPARNADIGIAAIDCGADAVYIAGPEFGARQAAGNDMSDIRRVCEYAHRFGARVFMTLNTILSDNMLEAAGRLLEEAREAGVDAIIAQDLAVWRLTDLPIHASTQCAVRTPGKARLYEAIGASRLVLEREMSLDQIEAVHKAVGCELEFFVHGALCVCYSGQCYMSESISRRSANRGECIQACRSQYDLADSEGNILMRSKSLLSLKDYNLSKRLEDLAMAGVSSFKIEGRLKNITYVRNVVREYSLALDALVEKHPGEYRRASFGRVEGGFRPNLDKTFNRGYTELFIDGKRGRWSCMDAPKSMGEEIGTVASIEKSRNQITLTVRAKDGGIKLSNGDGFAFVTKGHTEVIGFRGDVCKGNRITCKDVPELHVGVRLFRNMDSAFEKEVETNAPSRHIHVEVKLEVSRKGKENLLAVNALSQDGREVSFSVGAGEQTADNQERMLGMLASQIGKGAACFTFSLKDVAIRTPDGKLPFMPASAINAVRRDIAARLEETGCRRIPMPGADRPRPDLSTLGLEFPFQEINDGEKAADGAITYKANVSNRIAREMYSSLGVKSIEDAYELSHRDEAELMRTKYCIRHELGMCPVHQGAKTGRDLFLLNNGRRYALRFDCSRCEMVVMEA
jgi:Collagenase and related proteases